MSRQRQGLHRQHRQHAGHDVEDQAADQSKQQRQREGGRRVFLETCGRHGPWTRRHLQGLDGLIGGGQHQHAFEHPAFGELASRLQAQHHAVVRKAERLRRDVVHLAGPGREELRVRRLRRPGQSGSLYIELQIVVQRITHRPGRDGRNLGARRRELSGEESIGRWGVRIDVQGKIQHRVFGNADLAADQPLNGGAQMHLFAGLGIGRRLQPDQQPGFALIAVVHQRADRVTLRIRPLDRAGLPARRQGPFDLGRSARIAGIGPIGVPAGTDVLFQCHRQLAAGRHRKAVGDQPGDNLGRMVDLGRGGSQNRQQNEEREQEPAHHGVAHSLPCAVFILLTMGGRRAAHPASGWPGQARPW